MKELHPIQLVDITVTRLSIVVNDPKRASDFEGDIVFGLQRGISDFSPANPNLAVGLRADVKPEVKDGDEPAFVIEIELAGQFKVDYSKFNAEDIERWSEVNAPLLLLPYVREQVYGIALRAGVKGMIIPLFISKPANKQGAVPNVASK